MDTFEDIPEPFELDIAKGTFIASWPKWIRWILFLPTAIIGSVAASIAFKVIYTLLGFLSNYGPSNFFIDLTSSAVMGAVFVYGGGWMAPRYQFVVSIFLLVLITLFSAFDFLLTLLPSSSVGPGLMALHILVILLAAGGVVYHFKEEL